jgi:hypothetical protein
MNIVEEFIPNHPLNTAVLFLVFNRLDTTKQVFESIKQAQPPRLYIASDGARDSKEGEGTKVKAVRDYIMDNLNWECEVKTLFRESNLGCKMAVSGAIDWFFENEEMGIILEDDCLPSQSFFWFCEELLEKYKNDMRIWHIAGNNFHFGWQRDKDYSYYFGGIYGSIWGWASWKSRWSKYYDVNMKNYSEVKSKRYLENCYDGSNAVKQRIKDFNSIKTGLDTWDFQWVYTRWINNGLTVVPLINLVNNIGFGKDATHTKSNYDKRADMVAHNVDLDIKHPKFIIRDCISENKFYNDFINPLNLLRMKQIIKKLLFR